MKRSSLYVSAVVVLSVLFAVSGRLRMATINPPPNPDFSTDGLLVFGDATLNSGYPSQANTVVADYYQARTIPATGGGFITWYHLADGSSSFGLRVQKFNAAGAPLWGDGVQVLASLADKIDIVSDGAGGAFVVWATGGVFYAQRVDTTGALIFGSPIVLAAAGDCASEGWTGSGNQMENFAIPDNVGGVIVAWRASNSSNCVQRFDSTGALLWGANAKIHSAYGGIDYLVNDAGSGAWIGVSDNGTSLEHLDANGDTVVGCPVDSPINGDLLAMISDGAGGVIVVAGNSAPIAMRVGSGCVNDVAWPVGGQAIASSFMIRSMNLLLSGGQILATWRSGSLSDPTSPQRIMANKLALADGSLAWSGEKIAVQDYAMGADFTDMIIAVPSGADYIVTAVKGVEANTPSGGAIMVKLSGATGALVPAFGGEQTKLTLLDIPSTVVSDGSDGLVMTYLREYNIIYAQRYDSAGAEQWAALSGLVTPVVASSFRHYAIVGDPHTAMAPNGNKVIVWQTYDKIYNGAATEPQSIMRVKLLDGGGLPLGGGDGIYVLDTANGYAASSAFIDVQADNTGFYVLFNHVGHSAGEVQYISVQKFDFSGNALWAAGGIRIVSSADTDQSRLLLDGAGGIFTTYRIGFTAFNVLHIDQAGALTWNGSTGFSAGTAGYVFPYMVSDGSGGLYIARNTLGFGRLTHLDSTGTVDPNFAGDPDGVQIQGPGSALVLGLIPDGAGNFYIPYRNLARNALYIQKVSGTGALLWGPAGKVIADRGFAQSFDPHQSFRPAVPDGANGIVVSWLDSLGGTPKLTMQRFDENGNKLYGETYAAHLTTALAGGEATIEVDSTANFSSSGVIEIGVVEVQYNGTDGTHFNNCVNTPAAISGTGVTQMPGLRVNGNDDNTGNYWEISETAVGAVAAVYYHYGASNTIRLSYHSRDGAISYGGSLVLGSGISGNSPSMSRGNSKDIVVWLATPIGANAPYLYAQQYSTPLPPSAGAGAPTAAPVLGVDPVTGLSVVPGVRSATYYFANPGDGATAFVLYELAADGTRTKLAEINDPSATSIVENGLTPNTKYERTVVVVAANDKGESPDSEAYPVFMTLAEPPAPPLPSGQPKVKLTKTAEVIFPNENSAAAAGTAAALTAKPIIRYIISATNIGDAVAYSVDISDNIPNELILIDGTVILERANDQDNDNDSAGTFLYDQNNTKLTINVPDIEPNESEVIYFDTTPRDGVTMSVKNKATATYTDIPPTP